MENENNIQGIINKGNLELKIKNFKDKVSEVGKAVAYTVGTLTLGVGLIYGASRLLNVEPEKFWEGVPEIAMTPKSEYVVRSGDGFSTIAGYFNDASTSEIADAYNGRSAQIGDKIVYDSRKDDFIVYRNGNSLESLPVANTVKSVASSDSLERKISISVSAPKPQTITEGITSYTIPVNSGYGPWRVARELGISEDDVTRLLDGTQVMGGDKFYKIGDDYLALERGKVRVETELNL